MTTAFEQFPGESTKAFGAFKAYLELGPGRTLGKAAKRAGLPFCSIRVWSARYHWLARANDYVLHMAAVEQAAREDAVRQQATDWYRRQEVARAEEWKLHGECMHAGRAALARLVEKGRAATVQEILRLFEMSCKLGRLASGMDLDKTEVNAAQPQVRPEFMAALDKIYGKPLPGEIVDGKEVQSPQPAADHEQVKI